MSNDERDLLAVLSAELSFLEKGGYKYSARAAWRPHFIFQDSPTCLNFDAAQEPRPCSECVLMQFVPEYARGAKVPCRYISLNERQETIDSFYRHGTQDELERALKQWLKTTIARLESERAAGPRVSECSEISTKAKSASSK